MKSWNVIITATVTAGTILLGATAWAQGADGVPGDRLVVPLPDISGLDDAQAKDLARELAQANVITSNCPEYDVSDGAWQLMTGTTDSLTAKLGLDPITYDREYFRPAFSVMEDADACQTLGPDVQGTVDRLIAMGGDTKPAEQMPAAN
ncbi:hypothetical protein [Paracoccus sp. JM45]|uniref:hypothetical protein n=1 Tax=Paracoccus sp. JM45 TaxID=2283626 RepID=UPI000E6CE592|nr:hypothetical protein [Paracoccus sp. JM45]RJE81015.1 hypothetical protein DWB67_05350 [Paracoccus sp. JM45]